jgi:hypothetical protein
MEADFCWPATLMVRNDNKNQITAFLCFHLLGLTRKKALVRFARVLPFVISNIYRKMFFLPSFNFQLRCVLHGGACHVISNFITKGLPTI